VKDGREELNFSRWRAIDAKGLAKIAKELPKEIGEGEMPPWSYVLAHPRARLTEPEKKLLVDWARSLAP